MDDSSSVYFTELLKKFDFINGVWVTDYEGGLIVSSMKPEEHKETQNKENAEETDVEKSNKLKLSLSFLFNSAIDQISKIEKWKTNNLVTIFETVTVFQSKINKTILAHFICDSKRFNYSMMKEIVGEIADKLKKVEKEIDTLTQSSEAI